uniref:Uncharacterized protein n=1 Tax=Marmota marmota marmota TaxID=9994 RepID=A0A8C6EVD1_MARMA
MKNWQEGNHFLFSACSYVTLNKLFSFQIFLIEFLCSFSSSILVPASPVLCFADLLFFPPELYHFVSASFLFCTP